jgi:hypothetical protein
MVVYHSSDSLHAGYTLSCTRVVISVDFNQLCSEGSLPVLDDPPLQRISPVSTSRLTYLSSSWKVLSMSVLSFILVRLYRNETRWLIIIEMKKRQFR